MSSAPGWYTDPSDPNHVRWFDGRAWTAHVAPLPDTAPDADGSASPARTTVAAVAPAVPAPTTVAAVPAVASVRTTAPPVPSAPSSPPVHQGTFTRPVSTGYPAAPGYPTAPISPTAPGYPVAAADRGPVHQTATGYPGFAAPAPAYAGPPAPLESVSSYGPEHVEHWLLPVGRSWQSITSGWLAVLGLFLWPLAGAGPIGLAAAAAYLGGTAVLALIALRHARHGGHGTIRSVFALVTSTLSLVAAALTMIATTR